MIGLWRADDRKPNPALGAGLYRAAVAVFAGVLVLIVLLTSLDWLMHPRSLTVRNVRFEGEFRHVSHAELTDAVRELVGGNFLLLDLDSIRRRVEQLPWVHRADVRRLWPRDVSVQFEEQKVVARWRDQAWVNHAGEAVRLPNAGFPEDMPELAGPDGTSAQMLEQYQRLAPILGSHGLVLKRLVLTPRRTWEIELTNGIRLVLDRRDTGKKIERFAEVYAQHLAAKAANVQLVDLRYANGFAVRWRSGSTEAGR
jgi:cell division protein FtsQ